MNWVSCEVSVGEPRTLFMCRLKYCLTALVRKNQLKGSGHHWLYLHYFHIPSNMPPSSMSCHLLPPSIGKEGKETTELPWEHSLLPYLRGAGSAPQIWTWHVQHKWAWCTSQQHHGSGMDMPCKSLWQFLQVQTSPSKFSHSKSVHAPNCLNSLQILLLLLFPPGIENHEAQALRRINLLMWVAKIDSQIWPAISNQSLALPPLLCAHCFSTRPCLSEDISHGSFCWNALGFFPR